jgi:hypothetical protein
MPAHAPAPAPWSFGSTCAPASARRWKVALESMRAADLQRKHDEIAQELDALIDANRSLAAENATLRGAPG